MSQSKGSIFYVEMHYYTSLQSGTKIVLLPKVVHLNNLVIMLFLKRRDNKMLLRFISVAAFVSIIFGFYPTTRIVSSNEENVTSATGTEEETLNVDKGNSINDGIDEAIGIPPCGILY